MSLRQENLESFKRDLLARRETLVSGVRKTTDEIIHGDEVTFADSIDQASADVDRTLAVQIQNRDRGILAQINIALRRIDAGIFGECESCDEPITEARLRANPSTTLCIECKAELESEEQRFIARG